MIYSDLFNKIGIGWSPNKFHTFDKNAIAMAELSFADLKDKKLVYKAKREYFWCPDHKVSVSQAEIDNEGRYERSGVKVEMRVGEGWFVNMLDHIPRIRGMIDSIQWHPDVFRLRLHSWLNELKYDWSISRERNFGIHIPGEVENIVFDTINVFRLACSQMDNYNWPQAIEIMNDFFWNTFCSKWIENCKVTPVYETMKEVFRMFVHYFSIFFPNLENILFNELTCTLHDEGDK